MSKTPPRSTIRLVAAGLTDVGRQRRHNEDHVLVSPKFNLYVVADGMGGHTTGHVASALTSASLSDFFDATRDGKLPSAPPDDEKELPLAAQRLTAGVRKANRDVFEISSTHREHKGMGSTVVAIHFDGTLLHIAHVGDSRCYRIRDGEIEQLTRDHSLINDALAIKPDLTEDELARLPKNVITRALGMKEAVKVDVQSVPVEIGDTFLLCSDGLSGMIKDHQILEVFDLTSDLQEACELLIAMANEAGGVDNISALLVRAEEAEPASVSLEVEEAVLSQPLSRSYDEMVASQGRPVLELVKESDIEDETAAVEAEPVEDPLAYLRGIMSPEELAQLEAGELEAGAGFSASDNEPPSIDETPIARCKRCGHELYLGNAFCTECGLKISAS
ncbi:Stp1/IreP family PP2C-type Ser/Thr phosphatase [Polyangium aurulentum]|uniref:Stp1/IreP family PP2C-type Ser/Thr phosphatase n=1 Tax=Polyangium aurulentum TaxID=2567896 RepID=UPI0010ADF6E4|nr:Stp1/IreP family PP2C-type Ser/Thr phosphatase [Polyangium aurulentum]UQA56128.1 Stp1/IreP family PP2C-type Ser/Thr phosphatase [Polyangium aurulentum]